MSDRWLRGTGEGPELAREALDGIVAVYVEHGPVMRALADAAADDPRRRAGVQRARADGFIDATARHIEEEIAAGRVLPLDAHETAKALVWMMERYLHAEPRPRAADAAPGPSPTRSRRSGRACSTARAERASRRVQRGSRPARRADADQAVARHRRRARRPSSRDRRGRRASGQQPRPRRGSAAALERGGGAEAEREIARADGPAEHARRRGRGRRSRDPDRTLVLIADAAPAQQTPPRVPTRPRASVSACCERFVHGGDASGGAAPDRSPMARCHRRRDVDGCAVRASDDVACGDDRGGSPSRSRIDARRGERVRSRRWRRRWTAAARSTRRCERAPDRVRSWPRRSRRVVARPSVVVTDRPRAPATPPPIPRLDGQRAARSATSE